MTTNHAPTLMAAEVLPVPIHVRASTTDDGSRIYALCAPDENTFGECAEEMSADMIAQCVNAHDTLTARVAELEVYCESLLADVDCAAEQGYGPTTDTDIVRAALAKGA